MRTRARRLNAVSAVVGAVALSLAVSNGISGQEIMGRGQNIAPSYDGWMENPDGTFTLVFGYLNRNYEEQLEIPIGLDNNISPGPPDRGQPTHFYPRRQPYVFRVTVPKDFGARELVWTIVANGKTESAYGTLKPELVLDEATMMSNNEGGRPRNKNKAPVVRVEGTTRTVKVGEPLALEAFASDDGIPKPRSVPVGAPIGGRAQGMRVSWFVYRGAGAGKVTFGPEQFKHYLDYKSGSPWTPGWQVPPLPPDGRFPVTATFSEPGTYVLRVMAHDGGLDSTQDVTVTVNR